MRIDIAPASRGRHSLRFYGDGDAGELIHTDTIDIHNDGQRQKLIKRLVQSHNLNCRHVEEQMLTAIRQVAAAEEAVETDRIEGLEARTPYSIADGCICLGGANPIQVANFTASIVEEVTCHDGVDHACHFEIEGMLGNGEALRRIRIPAANFESMDWVVGEWGSRAIIAAGRGMKDHLRAAIQQFSTDVSRRTVRTHTGWCMENGQMVYLHAGGAIGAAGRVDNVETCLPAQLDKYELPVPPLGAELVQSIQASLGFLSVGPDFLTVPMLCAVYRSVLGDTDFSVHLVGQSGVFKSELAALAQQHCGSRMTRANLPANWISTANSLGEIAFRAKDSLLVIDDFCPTGTQSDIQRYHREADKMLRAQGNHAGRHRLTHSAELRTAKPPRGLILSTGEEVPHGQSLQSRMLVLEAGPGDINIERLTLAQDDAGTGRYAASIAGFVQWISPQYESIQQSIRDEYPRLRAEIQSTGLHARTPGIAASLLLGIRIFLRFAVASGALDSSGATALEARCRAALIASIGSQRAGQTEANPVRRFVDLISSLLVTGRARLGRAGNTAIQPTSHRSHSSYGMNSGSTLSAPIIGWTADAHDIYLDRNLSYAAAQKLAGEQGEAIGMSPAALVKAMRSAEMLVVESSQESNLHRLPSPNRHIRALRLRQGLLSLSPPGDEPPPRSFAGGITSPLPPSCSSVPVTGPGLPWFTR